DLAPAGMCSRVVDTGGKGGRGRTGAGRLLNADHGPDLPLSLADTGRQRGEGNLRRPLMMAARHPDRQAIRCGRVGANLGKLALLAETRQLVLRVKAGSRMYAGNIRRDGRMRGALRQ